MGHNLKFLIITIIAISLTDVLAARTYSRRVVLGDERFEEYQPLLQGKRVAVFSNQTGIVGDKVTGSKLADALAEYGGCFPEHPVAVVRQSHQPVAEPVEATVNKSTFDEISRIPFLEP